MRDKFVAFFFFTLGMPLLQALPKIESIDDLKKLEEQVQQVVRENTKVTVSLISPKSGGAGSGVIVSRDGLILTAAHVIEGNEFMTVIFPDGRQERARVLGANYTRDAAMARLLGEGPWPFAEVSDSRSLEVGDFVVAMGHPKGYDPTRRPPVRFGRVMTKRDLDFITTDCTLIGGDSGGPLFDLKGRVVGIHSNIGPDREINNHAGLSGFQSSWEKMLAGKSWGVLGDRHRDPHRPVIGINFRETPAGLLVESVPAQGPAFAAGLRPGDLVTSIAGQDIRSLDGLAEIFADLSIGDEISVTSWRGQKEMTIKVKLVPLSEINRKRRR